MKKFLSLLLCLVGAISYANADTAAYKTLEFKTSDYSKSVGDYKTTWEHTYNGFTWTLVNFSNNQKGWAYVRCGSKSDASVATISTKTAIDKPISSVSITIDAITASNVNSIKLYVSSSSTFSSPAIDEFTKAQGTQTVQIPTDKTGENLFYKIEFDCKKSSNGIVQISKVEYFDAEAKEIPTASFGEIETITFDCGIADEVYGLPALQTNSDGAITYEISGDALIEDDGSMAVINEPGTYTVTATVAETGTYAEASVSYTINAYTSLKSTIFKETFDSNEGTGGNDEQWSGSIASNDIASTNEGWAFNNAKGAKHCAKFGTGSAKGSAETPALSEIVGTMNCVLTFKAAAWDGKDEKTTLNLSISDGGSLSETSVTLVKGQWTDYTINITGATANSKIKFEAANANSNRFFLDEIEIFTPKNSQTLSIGSEGMTTFSSKNALDFSNAQNITAWVATEHDLDKNTIYLEKVTGTVAGGTGLILMGEPNATENIPVVESGDNYDSQNLLVKWYNGATIDASDGQNYVLAKIKNSPDFGFMNITNNLTNKTGIHHSYLHILDAAGNSPALRVVFGNGDTTGINDITVDNANEDGEMYNILGQKVDNSYRGFVIKNGEKFINK